MRCEINGNLALEVPDTLPPLAIIVLLPEIIQRKRARSELFTLVDENVLQRDVDSLVRRRGIDDGEDESASEESETVCAKRLHDKTHLLLRLLDHSWRSPPSDTGRFQTRIAGPLGSWFAPMIASFVMMSLVSSDCEYL